MTRIKTDPPAEPPTIVGELSVGNVHRGKKPFLLHQAHGPGSPRDFMLDHEQMVIGRSLQAHISIESNLLSRKHIELTRIGGEFRVLDLDSSNGLYLNGVKAHSAVLRDGDTLQIGDVVLVFHEGS